MSCLHCLLFSVGFAIKAINLDHHNMTLNVQELGGSKQIQQYWEKYYGDQYLLVSTAIEISNEETCFTVEVSHVHALPQIYVIDSSSTEEKLLESGEVLAKCLGSPSLSNTPLLIVCSKQDLPSARTVDEVHILFQCMVHEMTYRQCRWSCFF